MHDVMVKEYRPDQHKKYISMEVRPNAISCALYTNGVGEAWRSSSGYKTLL
jgi:hypothetical protein